MLERRAGLRNFAWIMVSSSQAGKKMDPRRRCPSFSAQHHVSACCQSTQVSRLRFWVQVGRGLRPEGGVGWQGSLERLAIERRCGGRLLQPGSLSGYPRVGSSDRLALAQGAAQPGRVWPEAKQVAKTTRSVALSMAPRGDSLGGMHGPDNREECLISADNQGDEEIPSGQQFNRWFASALLDTEVNPSMTIIASTSTVSFPMQYVGPHTRSHSKEASSLPPSLSLVHLHFVLVARDFLGPGV